MKIQYVFLPGLALLLAGILYGQTSTTTPPTSTQAPSSQSTGAPSLGLPTAGTSVPAPAMAQVPMTDKEVLSELKKEGAAQLLIDVKKRGVDFEMDPDTEKKLRKAKATDEVVNAVKAASPKGREAAQRASAMASGALVLPPEEAKDFQAIEAELDPDKAIALAEAFAKKYPKSEVLGDAYAFEASAYQVKGDATKIVEYGQKSLELKKDNIMGLGMLAYAIPTPQYIKNHQADEEQQLTMAENYAKEGLKAIETYKKPAEMSDADFAQRKANFIADLHGDLGMIHLDRAQLGLLSLDTDELAKAIDEYKLATTLTEHPDPRAYFRMGDAYRLLGKVDDAIAAYTKAGQMDPQGVLKQYADAQIASLQKQKALHAAPAPQ
jgi:tetratricopeptide (TPR) repeat protein